MAIIKGKCGTENYLIRDLHNVCGISKDAITDETLKELEHDLDLIREQDISRIANQYNIERLANDAQNLEETSAKDDPLLKLFVSPSLWWAKRKLNKQTKRRDSAIESCHADSQQKKDFVLNLPTTYKSTFTGMRGEKEVLAILSELPNDFYVYPDVNVDLGSAVSYSGKYRRRCQIDFVVVGTTGAFTLEVKHWSKKSWAHLGSESVIDQALLQAYALGIVIAAPSPIFMLILRRARKIASSIKAVVVTTASPAPFTHSDGVDAVTSNSLNDFILQGEDVLSEEDVSRMVNNLEHM